MDAIPAILNEPIFQKAFDVASLSNMEKNDYILYQISKSKKYDMQILSEEIAERSKAEGKAEGKAETEAAYILSFHSDGYAPAQISAMFRIPIENVIEVLKKHGITDIN